MNITMNKNGKVLIVAVAGRLDTLNSPELEKKLGPALEGIEDLVFDFSEVTYISSAGLRVLLTSMQIMETRGKMTVKNVTRDVMDIFEITGFAEDLNIE
ncbi:MAG: STAS domain-containing protein [Ruminococcus sp.]|nr:STAS domain-containing protein [Ruminococcus sp.]